MNDHSNEAIFMPEMVPSRPFALSLSKCWYWHKGFGKLGPNGALVSASFTLGRYLANYDAAHTHPPIYALCR